MCVFWCFSPRGVAEGVRPFVDVIQSQAIKALRAAEVGIQTFRADNRKGKRELHFGVFFPTINLLKGFPPLKVTFLLSRVWLDLPACFSDNDDVYRFQHGVRFFLPLQHRFSVRGESGTVPVPSGILLQHGITPVSGMSIQIFFKLSLKRRYDIYMYVLCLARE